MLPFICRCCGRQMELASRQNPNLCSACAEGEGDEEAVDEFADFPISTVTTVPQEMQYFLDPDGPTVLECYEATELARQAILEAGGSPPEPGPSKPVARPPSVKAWPH